MGEIADMMTDGDLCEVCGVWMGTPGEGIPRKCASCRRAESQAPGAYSHERTTCPDCGKRVKFIGLAQHRAAVHAPGKGGGT